jgi:hypothetical protein
VHERGHEPGVSTCIYTQDEGREGGSTYIHPHARRREGGKMHPHSTINTEIETLTKRNLRNRTRKKKKRKKGMERPSFITADRAYMLHTHTHSKNIGSVKFLLYVLTKF